MTYVPAFLRASFLAFLALASSNRPPEDKSFWSSLFGLVASLVFCLSVLAFFGPRLIKACSPSPRSSVTPECATGASLSARCFTCFSLSLPLLLPVDELAELLDGASFVEDADVVDLTAVVEGAGLVE